MLNFVTENVKFQNSKCNDRYILILGKCVTNLLMASRTYKATYTDRERHLRVKALEVF